MQEQFPIFANYLARFGHPLIYFDNASTTQLPTSVIDSMNSAFTQFNANVHRASYTLSQEASTALEKSRTTIASWINARYSHEVIFTRGCTESLNIIAQSIAKTQLKAQDEILVSCLEHHANFLPWQQIAKDCQAVLRVIPLNKKGQLDFQAFKTLINKRTKILALTHVSNVTGEVIELKRYLDFASRYACFTVVDGAQAIAHLPVDVQALNCDFYCFSAHKMYGPQGIGALYGKENKLSSIPNWLLGGNMAESVKKTSFHPKPLPYRLEAGTPNLAGAVGFAAAAQFINQHNHLFQRQEKKLSTYLNQALDELPLSYKSHSTLPLVSLTIDQHHSDDISEYLNQQHIAVRSGKHCAMPLMRHLNVASTLRLSLAMYNSCAEIDNCINALKSLLTSAKKPAPASPRTNEDDPLLSLPNIKTREQFFRFVTRFAETLPTMNEDAKIAANRIEECEALAWLSIDTGQPLSFSVDSESKLMKGVLGLLVAQANKSISNGLMQISEQELAPLYQFNKYLSKTRLDTVKKVLDCINQHCRDA